MGHGFNSYFDISRGYQLPDFSIPGQFSIPKPQKTDLKNIESSCHPGAGIVCKSSLKLSFAGNAHIYRQQKHIHEIYLSIGLSILVGGFNPSEKINLKVSWDYYSQYMGK